MRRLEGWKTPYGGRRFKKEEVKETLIRFLEASGYEIKEERIGFCKPDVYALKKNFALIISIREKIEEALDGCKELAAMKCFLPNIDYVLVFPPISEKKVLFFLVDYEEWYYPISQHAFMIWMVNPERGEVSPVIGWPKDELIAKYFKNPGAVKYFTQYAAQKITTKIMEEEF